MSRLALKVSLLPAALLVVLTVLVAVGWGPLLRVDHAVARAAYDATYRHSDRVHSWSLVTSWGDPSHMRGLLVIGALAFAAARAWRPAAWLATLVVTEAVLAPSAKLVLDRARPHWAHPIATAASTSFPSGHATAAAAAAAAVCLMVLGTSGHRLVRTAVPAVSVVLAALVAASRVFLGVHYLSDVVGGVLLGVALAAVSYGLWDPFGHPLGTRPGTSGRGRRLART